MFNLVKSFAIDADDGTLRYESPRVDALDDAENGRTFVFLRQNTQHVALLTRVPAVSVENRHAVFHLRTDFVGDFLPFLRENQELDAASLSVIDVVEHI